MKFWYLFIVTMILLVSTISYAEEEKESFLDNFVDRVINSVEPDADQDSRDITKKALRWTITGKDEDWNALDTKIKQVYGNGGDSPKSGSEINKILSDGNLSKEQKRTHLKNAYKEKKVIGDLVVYNIGPSVIHKGSNTIITYYVKNNSNTVLKNVLIETEHIKSRVYDDELGENDDYKENIILAPGDEAILQTIIKSDIHKSSGKYALDYYFQYTYESGNQIKTPLRKFEFELTEPNEDIVFTAIDPNTIHQGANTIISWLVKNNGNSPYKNVVIETDQIKRKIYGEELGENDDFKENLVLASSDEALLQTVIKADIGKPQGDYSLSYHLEFLDEQGNWYRTPDYIFDFKVTVPNEDIKFTKISPAQLHQGSNTIFSWFIENNGRIPYKNIVIETDQIKRKIYGEELGENDDFKENLVLASNDEALLQTIIKADIAKPQGDYALKYHLEFVDERGNWYRSPDYKFDFKVIEPNEDLRFLSINPNNIKRGTETKLNYEVKNAGSIAYKNVVIETENIKRKIYGEELGENDDYKENFTIDSNSSALFQTIIKAHQDKPTGEYKLLYHLEFSDIAGNWFRTPSYKYELLLE